MRWLPFLGFWFVVHSEENIKSVIFIRHGQAYSNIARCEDRPDLRDPLLTELGIRQARHVHSLFDHHINKRGIYVPEIILYSPLRRAIQTLNYSFITHCQNSLCVPLADLQEDNNAHYACDTGLPPHKLQLQFPSLNFSSLTLDWMLDGKHLEKSVKLSVRHKRVRTFLSSIPHSKIIIIAHQGTIQGYRLHSL